MGIDDDQVKVDLQESKKYLQRGRPWRHGDHQEIPPDEKKNGDL